MPILSRFYGITITMYYDDHNPAHFHAKYNGQEVQIGINDMRIIKGKIPPKALSLIMERAIQHQDELATNREVVKKGGDFLQIASL